MGISTEEKRIAAMNLELARDRDGLIFEKEYNLNTKPLEIGLLVVKKSASVRVSNEIGKIFRGHNIMEYKSPEDHLDIDAFYKDLRNNIRFQGFGSTGCRDTKKTGGKIPSVADRSHGIPTGRNAVMQNAHMQRGRATGEIRRKAKRQGRNVQPMLTMYTVKAADTVFDADRKPQRFILIKI